jgi:hypothetical protein
MIVAIIPWGIHNTSQYLVLEYLYFVYVVCGNTPPELETSALLKFLFDKRSKQSQPLARVFSNHRPSEPTVAVNKKCCEETSSICALMVMLECSRTRSRTDFCHKDFLSPSNEIDALEGFCSR